MLPQRESRAGTAVACSRRYAGWDPQAPGMGGGGRTVHGDANLGATECQRSEQQGRPPRDDSAGPSQGSANSTAETRHERDIRALKNP